MPILRYINGKFENVKIEAKNGQLLVQTTKLDRFDDHTYWCPMCHTVIRSDSWYRTGDQFKYVNGEVYCLSHYPVAVDAYLADKRLREEG